MNFQEVKEKKPSKNYAVELEKRSKGKIKMNGGNDYQLNPVNKNVKKKVLKKITNIKLIRYGSAYRWLLLQMWFQLKKTVPSALSG